MLLAALAAAAFVLLLAALSLRRVVGPAQNPQPVIDAPALPRALAPVQARLDQWRAEGRISREDHERFSHLVREDAAPPPVPGKSAGGK